jgi:putative FmdB family regulatory protein
MPTYVYRCTKQHTFELFHAISDESPKKCPRCGSAAKRIPAGGSGVLFRGSGFYATDYRSKSYKESAKRESGDAGKKSDGAGQSGAGEGGSSKSSKSQGSSGDKKDG